jgi:hypothetical protein
VRRLVPDNGNVIVEFIGVTIALLIPLSIIASSCIQVANAYLLTEASARTAARAYAISKNDTVGASAANSAAGLIADDFGTNDSAIKTKIFCTMKPCLTPGGFVTVSISKQVRLDLPRVFGSRTVLVSSQHTAAVDELRVP